MSKQPETLFKEKVQRRLKAEFGDTIWFKKTEAGAIRGIPDLLICYKGRFVAWELKTEKGRADKLQVFNLSKIGECGGIAEIVRPSNLEEKIECLKSF